MINLIYIFFLISILFNEDRGWTHPETGWQVISGTHMSIYMISNVFINNQTDSVNVCKALSWCKDKDMHKVKFKKFICKYNKKY